jgi:prophage regulatory protein
MTTDTHGQTAAPARRNPHNLLRISDVAAEIGGSASLVRKRIRAGLWVRPISIAHSMSVIPAGEVDALKAAIVAGATEDQVRALVARLHAARPGALRDVLGDDTAA